MSKEIIARKSERGMSTTTVLLFSSGIALASAALITQVRDSRSATRNQQGLDVERRVNEAALQKVSQLINNGLIYFNPTSGCGIAEPQTTGASQDHYDRKSGCGSAVSKLKSLPSAPSECTAVDGVDWRYVVAAPSATTQCKKTAGSAGVGKCESVEICVSVPSKDASGKTVDRKEKVVVSFYEYGSEKSGSGDASVTERRTAILRAQRPGKNKSGLYFSSLKAKVNFGAVEDGNKGLIGKYGATDTCFYMRPATVSHNVGKNLGFAARAPGNVGNYGMSELEPRPDGKLKDEFGQEISHSSLTEKVTASDYAVLTGFRNKLISDYYAGGKSSRGERAEVPQVRENKDSGVRYVSKDRVIQAAKYSGPKKDTYFVGVMPRLGAEGGPEFNHFLTGSKSEPKVWNPALVADYKDGCARSAKSPGADFCTRVDVPREEYSAKLGGKCTSYEGMVPTLKKSPPPPPPKEGEEPGPIPEPPAPALRYSDKSIQVTCSAQWVAEVRSYLNREQAALRNTEGMASPEVLKKETTLAMAVSALEVDDEFVKAEGRWATNPIPGESGPHPLVTAYRNFDLKLKEGDYLDGNTIVHVGKVVEHDASDAPRKVTVSKIVKSDSPIETTKYVSQTCAYFTYFKATEPSSCNFSYKTKDEESYVCRNHDGCFDETTLIRMADGSDRLVTQLRKGEFVYNPVTQKPAKIVKLTIGPELKPLIHVAVGGKLVKVTDTHPFMTRRGWIQARALTTSDEILSGRSRYLKVTSVTLGATGRTVANLALEGPADQHDLHYVLADGVVTGDLVIQNMIDRKAAIE